MTKTKEELMSDDSTTTIRAIFKTREAADLAIEHLVRSFGDLDAIRVSGR